CIFLFLMFSIPPMSTLFPYTTLFRSFKVLILVFYLDGVFQPSLVEIKKRFSSILYTVKTELQKRKCSRVKSLKMGNNLMPDVISFVIDAGVGGIFTPPITLCGRIRLQRSPTKR